MIEFNQDTFDTPYFIQRLGDSSVKIQNQDYKLPILVHAKGIYHPWPSNQQIFKYYKKDAYNEILNLNPELIIIGTGECYQSLPNELLSFFHQQQIGVETMINSSAVRTYNLLLADYRNVVCIILS